jgi:L-ascorbate metabolism protein UlaG (beta-lactamase superfamily)
MIKKTILSAVLVLLVAVLLAGLSRPDAPGSSAGRKAPWPPEQASPVRATFVGVSTLMFDDGKSAILVDGFFSRPGFFKTALGRVGPDTQAVTVALRKLGLIDGPLTLLAVVTAHSHYDHAMDAPLVARLTGAQLLGSESTAFIGLGQGLDNNQITIAEKNRNYAFGPFVVQMIPSLHSPTPWNNGHDGGELVAPLVPPVHAADYKEGGSYSLLFEYQMPRPEKDDLNPRWLVQGSAGYVSGQLDGVRADTVFLGVGTLGRKRGHYKEAYWLEVVTTVGAHTVVPIHWDDFTRGLDVPLQAMPYLLDNLKSTVRFIQARQELDSINVQWMQSYDALQLRLPVAPTDPLSDVIKEMATEAQATAVKP